MKKQYITRTGVNIDHEIQVAELITVLAEIPLIRESEVFVGEHEILIYYVANSAGHEDNNDQIIENWENLFNFSVYDEKRTDEDVFADFSGWASVLTGKTIPIEDMKCWRTWILDQVKALIPQKVLEIGVGSGLIMYPLLDQVTRFVGLDLSKAVIERHLAFLKDKHHDVDLFHLRADQIDELPITDRFDTIIINSVCQYFPNVAYFRLVLEKALELLNDQGVIFLGDVRNHDLHRLFVEEKMKFENRPIDEHITSKIVFEEDELFLSPDYLIRLYQEMMGCEVQILERPQTFHQELSKFRYDVIITRTKEYKVPGEGTNLSRLQGLHNVPFLSRVKPDHLTALIDDKLLKTLKPISFMALDEIPRLANGQVDFNRLNKPNTGPFQAAAPTIKSDFEQAKLDLSDLDFDF